MPAVTRVGFGFGGAYGKGIVIEDDSTIGRTKYWQFSSGIQLGAKYYSMIIFFKDKQALDDFKTGELQFMGQAGLSFATVGVAGTPAYNDGVAIVTMTRFGLLGEFSADGAKFTYKRVADEEGRVVGLALHAAFVHSRDHARDQRRNPGITATNAPVHRTRPGSHVQQ